MQGKVFRCIKITTLDSFGNCGISRYVLRPVHAGWSRRERAERLLSELDLSRDYPYEFIFFRVTEFRPEENSRKMVRGEGRGS